MPPRGSTGRALATTALLLYSAALFLSALPSPVRPGWLVAPSEVVKRALRSFGLRGGITVFLPPRERVVELIRNDCIYVRGVGADGTRRWLLPPDGHCVVSGFRPALPTLEWMTRSILTGGEASLPQTLRQAAVADFFCHGPRFAGEGFETVELLWVQPRLHIETGAPSEDQLLLYRWRCTPPGLLEERIPPSPEEVRRFLEAGS